MAPLQVASFAPFEKNRIDNFQINSKFSTWTTIMRRVVYRSNIRNAPATAADVVRRTNVGACRRGKQHKNKHLMFVLFFVATAFGTTYIETVVGGTVLYPSDAIYNCYGDVLTFQGSVPMFILRFSSSHMPISCSE
jgi:hypothetical protein